MSLSFLVSFPLTFGALFSNNLFLCNTLFLHNTLFIRSKVLFYNICCYGLYMSLHTLLSRNILLSHSTLFIRSKVLFYNICCLSLHMSRSDSEISSLMVLQHFVLTKPLFWYNICYDRTFVLLARLCPTVTEMVRFEYRTFVLQQQMLSKNKVLHLLLHCLVDLFEHYSKLLGRLTTLYESVA